MDSTTLYYFFSTISQTLAGLVGVLGAFTVLRLTDLEGRLNRALDEMDGQTEKKKDLAERRAAGDIDGLIVILDKEIATRSEDSKPSFSRVLEHLRQASQGKKALYASGKVALASTGVAIALALVGILAADKLVGAGRAWLGGAIVVQIAALGWAAICYWRLATLTIGGRSKR